MLCGNKLHNKETLYVIYKQNKDGNLVQYMNTKELSYKEKADSRPTGYAVRIVTKDGGKSKVSDVITINQ